MNKGTEIDLVQLEKKVQKAQRYATELNRFELQEIKVKMKSKHDTRVIQLKEDRWTCTCEFYSKNNTCSHIMAVQEILRTLAFTSDEKEVNSWGS